MKLECIELLRPHDKRIQFDLLLSLLVEYAGAWQVCRNRFYDVSTEYDDWVLRKPAIYDKEFFDTNSGSWMIASYVGLNPEFGITVEVPEVAHQKGVNWLDKIKTKNENKVPNVRGRSRR